MKKLLQEAKQGNARAQYDLSKLYFRKDTEQDYKKAFDWCKKSADQGDAQAQYNLALMHELVWQIIDNYDQTTYDDEKRLEVHKERTNSANYWFKKSAIQGYAKAEFQIGFQNYDRFDYLGDEKYYKEALKWLQSSAEKGITGAQYYLGLLYNSDKMSNITNPEKASYWLNKSKDLNNVKEEFILEEVFQFQSKWSPEPIPGNWTSVSSSCKKGNASSCYTIALWGYQHALAYQDALSNQEGYLVEFGSLRNKSVYNQTYIRRVKESLEQAKIYLRNAYSNGIEAHKDWKRYELWKY